MIKQADENSPAVLPKREAFQDIVNRANAGDAEALSRLRKLLDEHDVIWKQVGDLGRSAEVALIEVMANGDELLRESLTRSAQQMRKELLGKHPTALEKICVQRIVANLLETQWAGIKYPEPTGELKWAKFVLSRKDSAERRLQASIKSLTLVKKMLPAAAPEPTKRKKKRRKVNGSSAKAAVAAGGPVNRVGDLLSVV